MRVAILIAPKDFKDESVSNAKLLFQKWNIEAVITSYSTKECVGYHGAIYKPDINAAKLDPQNFDALFLVDGKGVEEYKLYDFRALLETVKQFSINKKPIAAINNAIKIVARANIVSNVKIATPQDSEIQRLVALYHGTASRNEIEDDKGILTLSNPEKIYEFADLLVSKLGAK
ncbi:MAG: DJ-1/PfpI family protein [Candidatus Micrarchaeota archaeon]|nr:DJ-1/PfpI family protein [Candidatus Micrarchaeota archaeon]MDE1834126.1 DJ-1/PfpI family protein [Candidatus Micrarchaeota archaeon]